MIIIHQDSIIGEYFDSRWFYLPADNAETLMYLKSFE